MPEETVEVADNFLTAFFRFLVSNPDTAITLLVGTFLQAFAGMSKKDRTITLLAMLPKLNEMKDEQFEDGQDFLSFMKEGENE